MVLSTPIKAASGVILASAAVAGTALTYKYSTSLYTIEEIALEANDWTIEKFSDNNGSTTVESGKKTLTVSYKISKSKDANNIWSCTLTATSTFNNNPDPSLDDSKIKEDLKGLFGVDVDASQKTTLTVPETHKSKKEGFFNSCLKNRKESPAPNNNKVESQLNISLKKTSEEGHKYQFSDKDLEEISKGTWINKTQK